MKKLLIRCKDYLESDYYDHLGIKKLITDLAEAIEKESPTREDVTEVIVESVDIRGIELRNYKMFFEESNVYENLCEIFGVEPKLTEPIIKQRTYSVPLWKIKKECGWGKFCDVTGVNEWSIREGLVSDDSDFTISESQGEELGL